jgi:N-acetylmuramoyl-L-alanine amidase
MRQIDGIVVHCSATPAGKPFRAADIDRWHREKGWDGIGYHFVIPLDGSIEPGRDLASAGAHVSGHNARTIGVCYIGGMNAQNTAAANTLNAEQADALELLLRGLRAKWPKATIRGHRDYPKVAKACPSFEVQAWCTARGLDAR